MTRKISLFLVLAMVLSLNQAYSQANNLKLTAKPKDMWEFGLHVGHSVLTGDVDWNPNYGFGIHLRKSLDYAFSIRLDAGYYQMSGEENENERQVDAQFYGFSNSWKPVFDSRTILAHLDIMASLNQVKIFRKNKINPYGFVGLGVGSLEATVYADENKNNGVDVSESRDFDDEWDISAFGDAGVGIGFLLSDKVTLSLEHKLIKYLGRAGDLLDGVEFQGSLNDRVITKDDDLHMYTSLRLGINLGKKEEKSIPLWWVSPLDLIAEDLAEVKARPILDLTDTDKDGVIDMLDAEKDTPEGYPVDTRGVRLDSDEDGVVDGEDEERYSPPGYNVDSKGVAQVPVPDYVNEDDVNRIVDAKIANYAATTKGLSDWFLPMIHFNLDRYDIRNAEYGKLHNVATVMKNNPDIRVVARGYTDRLASNCYNDLLSYNRAKSTIDYMVGKYGIPRDRFILTWGGEEENLVPTNGGNMMNRRVEFTVAKDETEMARPDCGVNNAGRGGRSGSQYSGNKEAGY